MKVAATLQVENLVASRPGAEASTARALVTQNWVGRLPAQDVWIAWKRG